MQNNDGSLSDRTRERIREAIGKPPGTFTSHTPKSVKPDSEYRTDYGLKQAIKAAGLTGRQIAAVAGIKEGAAGNQVRLARFSPAVVAAVETLLKGRSVEAVGIPTGG